MAVSAMAAGCAKQFDPPKRSCPNWICRIPCWPHGIRLTRPRRSPRSNSRTTNRRSTPRSPARAPRWRRSSEPQDRPSAARSWRWSVRASCSTASQGLFFNLLEADSSDEMQEIAQRKPKLTELSNDISLDPELFARVKYVYEHPGRLRRGQKLLENTYRGLRPQRCSPVRRR